MRERLVYGILIAILIILFAFVFAVLGRGEYEPSGSVDSETSYALSGPITS